MKNATKLLALVLALLMLVPMLFACGGGEDETEGAGAGTAGTETESTGGTTPEKDDTTLVVAYQPFSSKFSPFFATTSYDQDVAGMTQVGLLSTDREGNVILKGKTGETVKYNGTDYTYNGLSDCTITENDDGTVVYDFVLREDVKFSDGTPLTADDVIFSMYAYSDPTYDGSSTFYSLPIKGMAEYRSGMTSIVNLVRADLLDDGAYAANDYYTEEIFDLYVATVPVGGALFAQDIVDYCMANYAAAYVPAIFEKDPADLNDAEIVAFGMWAWGFGDFNDEGSFVYTASTGDKAIDLATATLTVDDYFDAIVTAYEGDLAAFASKEAATMDLFTCINNALEAAGKFDIFAKGVSIGNSATTITGIEKTGKFSVRVTLTELSAKAIYQLPITVAPLHYYGDVEKYDYEAGKFGFDKGDLSSLRAKTTQPLGAGAYKFVSFNNGVVTFEKNDLYFLGTPKIQYILFKETATADMMAALLAGDVDIAETQFGDADIAAIKEENGNDNLVGPVITTIATDFNGYGYLGMSAYRMNVGGEIGSDASKNLRRGFATVLAAYREASVYAYYGERASVINYPISNTSWAAPKANDEGYEIAFSTDVNGAPIYTAGMADADKPAAALAAAVGFFKAAGYTYDEATGKFTAAPEGASLEYECLIPGDGTADHPSYAMVNSASEALKTIGINLIVTDLTDSNKLWDGLDTKSVDMWVAAWGAAVDPDMYQVYHSSNVVGLEGSTGSNHYYLQSDELDAKIALALTKTDKTWRKAVYKECLDIVADWAVELPVYQRKEAMIYSTERVKVDTLPKDITPFYGWMAELENLQVND